MEKFRSVIDALSLREQRLVSAMLVVLIGVLLKFLVFGDVKEIISTRSQISADAVALAQKEKMLSDFARAPAANMASNPSWIYYQENIGLSSLLRKISNKDSALEGFHITRITSEKLEKVNDYEKTTLKVEIEAPFNAIGGFLEDLEKSRLLTRVEGVEITRLDKELRLCHAKISLNSYAWRDK